MGDKEGVSSKCKLSSTFHSPQCGLSWILKFTQGRKGTEVRSESGGEGEPVFGWLVVGSPLSLALQAQLWS